MIAWVDGRIQHHCARCWTPIPAGEYCSPSCAEHHEPGAWRCPDCVTRGIRPCPHMEAAGDG